MVEWSRAFGDVPIYLHADHAPWVMRADGTVRFWEGESMEVAPGVRVLRCGGHFPGSSVLHWPAAEDGRGALFTGDTIKVVADARYVTFMYSYPNDIPLDARTVRAIADVVESLPFARLYDGWTAVTGVTGDAKEAVRRSAERYIAHVQGTA